MENQQETGFQEYPLSVGVIHNKKKYHVARFSDQQTVDFKKFAEPVKMVSSKSTEEELVMPPSNPSLNKQTRRRQLEKYFEKKKQELTKKKVEKLYHMEDADGENAFDGAIEGGQADSRYAIFMMEGTEFKIYPVDSWYNFKSKKKYHTLTLEEAEAQITTRKVKVDRWLMQKYQKKEEGGEITGEMSEEKQKIFEDDKFTGFDTFEPSKKGGAKVKKEEVKNKDDEEDKEGEEPEEKGEEVDFEKSVSDDEEDEPPENEDEKENKNDEDKEEAKNLSNSGKEMKSILKNAKKDEMEFASDEDDDSDDDEDDFNVNDLDIYAQKNQKEQSGDSTQSETGGLNKRPLQSPTDGPDAKKAKLDANGVPTAVGDVDEEEVRKILLTSGKIKTKNLINKFKSRLTDQRQKARFAQIVKKIGEIVEELGEKYLILKHEYRGGLKIGK